MMTKYDLMRKQALDRLNFAEDEQRTGRRRRVTFRKVYSGPGYPVNNHTEKDQRVSRKMKAVFGLKWPNKNN